MKPFNKKDIIPEVAKELGMSEEDVSEITSFYWKEVAVSMREMKHISIYIHELGDMRFAKSKLELMEERILAVMKTLEPGTRMDQCQQKIDRIQVLKQLRQEDYEKKEKVIQRKNEHKQNKKDLEK